MQRDSERVGEFASLAIKLPSNPTVLTQDRVKFITRMVVSELMELAQTVSDTPQQFVKDCCDDTDLPTPKLKPETTEEYSKEVQVIAEQADAFVDIIYYIYDTAAKHGINLGPVFDNVHEANMNKRFPDGTLHKRPDGKVIKPPGWEAPNIASVIKKQMQ